jgi:hypothetical protein
MIPQPVDKKLAELDDMAASILVSLRVLKNNRNYDPRQVRERLQAFCDSVLDVANQFISGDVK